MTSSSDIASRAVVAKVNGLRAAAAKQLDHPHFGATSSSERASALALEVAELEEVERVRPRKRVTTCVSARASAGGESPKRRISRRAVFV
jgi:hypothetical protein